MARVKISKETYKKALKIALPAIIETFFLTFVGLVDSFMVSSISSYAVAAVGLTAQPKFIGLALFMATGVSTSAIVARRYGENRKKDANQTLVTTLIFTLIMGVVISLIFVFGADTIIRLCGSSPNTHDDAVTYLKIIMGGMIFNCIQIAINSAQRGAGNTRITMTTNVTSNLVNVVFTRFNLASCTDLDIRFDQPRYSLKA
jgi:Na+-driven multidrug efflux pump